MSSASKVVVAIFVGFLVENDVILQKIGIIFSVHNIVTLILEGKVVVLKYVLL